MEQPEPNKAQIRGKDLIGGIKVMPMGLDAAIKKRTSGEFKSEQKGGTTSFSNANQQMESFKEEVSGSSGFNQVSSLQSASKQSSSMKSSAMQSSSMQSSTKQSFQSSSSSSNQMTASSQMSSSAMSSSSQKSMSSMTSSKSVGSTESNSVSFQSSGMVQQDVQQVCDVLTKPLVHNQEIEQDKLKTQIVSAITDLEGDREFVDFGRENKPIDLTSPPQAFSPPPKSAFTPTKQDPFSPSKQDMFSPPPLEPMEPPKPQPVLSSFTSEPAELAPQLAPTRNGIQNGFSEFVSNTKNLELQTIQESSQMKIITDAFQMNGNHEESGSIQGSSSSSSLLQKIMTPAPTEYDSGSLKRRDPKKMFTDSSFYNAKHHPTVADQVEMAHRLSSAMFDGKNKSSKGQQMYLTRVQNSGGMHDDDYQKHEAVPNLKLVMNPEGKVHEWDDLPEDQKPNYNQIAVHAAPHHNLPDVADPVAESLNAGVGKGEPSFSRPNTFVSAYRRVFDQHRGVFGTQGNAKTPESPIIPSKHTHATPKEMSNKTVVTQKSVTTPENKNIDKSWVKSCENLTKGTKDIVSQINNKNIEKSKGTVYQNKVIKHPESPKAPPRKQAHFLDNRDVKPSEILDNNRGVTVRRHKSFNEENKGVLDNRRPKYVVDNYPNLNSIKPTDVLKTPYLLPTSTPSTTNQNVGNFPQINSTSMVAKTKALFEEKDNNSNFIQLGKSRTFSSFPTGNDNDVIIPGCPLTPSVPQRNSSRKVFATYKSMNANMNHCGTESGNNSPAPERRIPMRNFF
eukprot:GFUD01037925.1.p1 GENE.GFUD01037925.1~~GFUD01037925.1.p1  ORF type:complete len:788 (+),score=145.42 GFUD01037925.1:382-2745(+)